MEHPVAATLLQGVAPQSALLAGIVAIVAVFVLKTLWREPTPCALANSGKSARVIHELPSRLPILGDLVERLRNHHRVHDWMADHSRRVGGEPWVMSVPGQPPILILTKPEALEQVSTTQFHNFPKGKFQYEVIGDMFGAGLVTSDGARWYHQRKAATRFFTAKTLRALMMQSMQKNMAKLYAVIDHPPQSQAFVDLKKLFFEFTIDTFAEMGLGVELNCIGAATPHAFQTALDTVSPLTLRRMCLPTWLWKCERWLNVGPEAELAKRMAVVRAWLRETIQKSLAARLTAEPQSLGDGNAAHVKSIVELFADYSSHNDATEGMETDDLLDFVLTFVVAARDTTADTLCWFFYALSKHPHVEHKIREEMQDQLGGNEREIAYLTTDHVKKLTYLEATIKETLRLYPAGPFTFRQAAQDTVICDDIVIRKGHAVGMCAYAIARQPSVWGPDASEFKPERWIDDDQLRLRQFPTTKFFSFGAGPRSCIGMGLAMLELRIVVANLLCRYRFDVDPANDGSYNVAPTLSMKHPLLVKATHTSILQ